MSVLYFDSMGTQLTETLQEALSLATASLRVLADESGLHQTTLSRWRTGDISGKPESAVKLARVLHDRALRLLNLASRIEAMAETERRATHE